MDNGRITELVDAYFAAASPRSEPYRQGFRYGVTRALKLCDVSNPPYALGTTEFDAWSAGNDAAKNWVSLRRRIGTWPGGAGLCE